MFRHILILVSFCVLIITPLDAPTGYYWREYLGKIPNDAISAGINAAGENVYIGQAFKENRNIVVEILPGDDSVLIPSNGTTIESNSGLKILCGCPDDFSWILTNSTAFSIDMIDRHPVIGGFKEGTGVYHIGRISLESGIKIGGIASFDVQNSKMHFAYQKKEVEAVKFETLIYKLMLIDVRYNSGL